MTDVVADQASNDTNCTVSPARISSIRPGLDHRAKRIPTGDADLTGHLPRSHRPGELAGTQSKFVIPLVDLLDGSIGLGHDTHDLKVAARIARVD